MTDATALALASATLGVVALALCVLATRAARTSADLLLGVILVCAGLTVWQLVAGLLMPDGLSRAVAMALPALLGLGPAFYFYVVALTTEGAWKPDRTVAPHIVLPALGLACAALFVAMPAPWRDAMILRGALPDSGVAAFAALTAFALVIAWVPQSGFYLASSFLRLARYRRRLKDLFASNEGRELHWIVWLLAILGLVWCLAVVALLGDNLFDWLPFGPRAGASMGLAFALGVSVWGLRQRPGFDGRVPPAEPEQAEDKDRPAKYSRSGVNPEQAERLAKKIDAAMLDDRLYLDPDLSLHGLAKHLGAPAHRVSQTLNETLGESFFDYVNRRRVEAAKPLVAAGEASILAIAYEVGFNARSSFYTSFKRVTGLTPSQYRQRATRAE